MKDFISLAACRRSCPVPETAAATPRPHILTNLLAKRTVPRVLCAPTGFGKTTCAAEYARFMFGFDHVFWLDGTSPCFLRDLDTGRLADLLLAADTEPVLAVLDDVPVLDEGRARMLREACEALAEIGCEVLMAVTPAAGTAIRAALGAECVWLEPEALCVTPEELRAVETAPEGAAAVVPSYVWGDAAMAEEKLLAGLAREGLEPEAAALMAEVLLLGAGEVSPEGERAAALAELSRSYPFVQMDGDGWFSTPGFAAAAVARSLRAAVEPVRDMNELLAGVADALAGEGEFARACEVATELPTCHARCSWLEQHQAALFSAQRHSAALKYFANLGTALARYPGASVLRLGQAARLLELGCKEEAAVEARHALAAAHATPEVKEQAALLLVVCGESVPAAPEDELHRLVADVFAAADHAARAALLQTALAMLTADWHSRSTAGALFCARYLLQALAELPVGHDVQPSVLLRLSTLIMSTLTALQARDEALTSDGLLTAAAYSAASALRVLSERGVPVQNLSSVLTAAVRRTDLHLSQEAAAARAILAEPPVRVGGAKLPFASKQSTKRGMQTAVPAPLLHIRLFGALEVRIGDREVPQSLLARQKVKTALVLLSLNLGREIARQDLMEELWPGCFVDVAKRSFYAVWSMLRRALSVEEDRCPYLERAQYGLRLKPDLVRTDVARFEEICRAFQLGRVDATTWLELLDEVLRIYRGPLLPSETESKSILAARVHFATELVDALVRGATRLLEAGESQPALYFAQSALDKDAVREDVYAILMRAQLACGQRTSAVNTYFACREMLSEGLGLDPSAALTDLYLGIIDAPGAVTA